jgi:phenylpyruvate tautomerase PptA (4-oxalocrotonate tautomerase family)
MPHVIVKLWPGKSSKQQKTRLAEAITKDVREILHYGEESVSVAIEEIRQLIGLRKFINPKSLRTQKRCTRNRDTTYLNCHEDARSLRTYVEHQSREGITS